jgi:hypothetical protein
MFNSKPKSIFDFLFLSTGLSGIFSALVLVAYAYLGTFSRHMADDFCSVDFTRTNFLVALWDNYLTISDRFSNFMLIALSEYISPHSVTILPALMLLLWIVGVAWFLYECTHYLGLNWSMPFILVMTCLLLFLALLQAPNLYQILYWRSSMAVHFAPLVFMSFFLSFLLRNISKGAFSGWHYPLVFILALLLGGFSEPTTIILIGLLSLAILAAWLWINPTGRTERLWLLICALSGAMLALVMMAIAPANSLRLGDPPPALPLLISRSFEYVFEFSLNSFKTLPLPTFFTVTIPFLIFVGMYSAPGLFFEELQKKRVILFLIATPIISYLLMVGSFAPSVYGQSFPVQRARFSAQLILTVALMIEGAGLGFLFAQWRTRVLKSLPVRTISALLLMITAFYPLRAAFHTFASVPEYRTRAELWDMREAFIYKKIAQGELDLVVPGYPGIYGVKEWDDRKTHWVNRCVATYYNLDGIRTVAVPDGELQDFFSE